MSFDPALMNDNALVFLLAPTPALTRRQRRRVDDIPDPKAVRAWNGTGVVAVYVYSVISVTRHLVDENGYVLDVVRFHAGEADRQIRRELLAGLAAS